MYRIVFPKRPDWLSVALLAAIFSCGPAGQGGAVDVQAAEPTDRVRVYLISLDDGGASGPRVGCGDSAVPVEIALPRERPALEGALAALLAIDEQVHPASGLYNALYASPLEVVSIQQSAGVAAVQLSGYVEVGGACDAPRVLEQLRQTALQFPDVERVELYLQGTPLSRALAGTGTVAR